jgi:hypothetical protein
MDQSNPYLRIALAVNDDIDADSNISLVQIEVPPVPLAQAKTALVLKEALINDGYIPSKIVPTISTAANIPQKRFEYFPIQQLGARLLIENPGRLPVSVAVFDLRGRELFAQSFAAANTVVRLSLDDLSAGVYLTKVRIGNTITARTFVVGR